MEAYQTAALEKKQEMESDKTPHRHADDGIEWCIGSAQDIKASLSGFPVNHKTLSSKWLVSCTASDALLLYYSIKVNGGNSRHMGNFGHSLKKLAL